MPRDSQPYWNRSPEWIIFDLDGTLADISHRLKYIKIPDHDGITENEIDKIADFIPDWDKFNGECYKDVPKSEIVELLKMCHKYGKSIAIFTGRMETTKERTIEWLRRNGISYDLLEMRKSKDYRSDVDVKNEMFEKHFEKEQIWFVVDDRDKVVDLWRKLGLTCLQCQKGDY